MARTPSYAVIPLIKIKIYLPSTTANLDLEFDVVGVVLLLYNEFETEYVPNARKINFILTGEGKNYFRKVEKILFGSQC
jgi:homoserine kinase